MDTAKLFRSGRSQAVRLPRDYRFSGSEVALKHFGNGVLQLPLEDPWQALEIFLVPLPILPSDESACWAYGDLRADLERRGTPIGSLDTMSAAHAPSQEASLITNNTTVFSQVPGLQLDNRVPAA